MQHERLKAGFSDGQHYFILQPVMVIRRYCSGLYNVVITYMGREKTVIVTEGNTKPLSIEVVVSIVCNEYSILNVSEKVSHLGFCKVLYIVRKF